MPAEPLRSSSDGTQTSRLGVRHDGARAMPGSSRWWRRWWPSSCARSAPSRPRHPPLAENVHLRQELEQRNGLLEHRRNQRSDAPGLRADRSGGADHTIRDDPGRVGHRPKELIAPRASTNNSPAAGKPFVKVSCAALPETLIEAELFGTRRALFTGAQQRKQGRFRTWPRRPALLDEIGELNLASQVKILRVLQKRGVRAAGRDRDCPGDVRLVWRPIAIWRPASPKAVPRGPLLRLNVFSIFLPPLRDRKPDIMLLPTISSPSTPGSTSGRSGRTRPRHRHAGQLSLAGPRARSWRTPSARVVTCDGQVIHGHHLRPRCRRRRPRHRGADFAVRRGRAVRKDLIVDALKSARGNRAKAARLLGAPSGSSLQGAEVRDRSGALPRRADGGAPASALEVGGPVAWDASHRRNCRMTSLKHSP